MLVMGLNGIGATWFLQTEYFSKLENYQVCVFDNRGIGNSSAPKGFYSTKAMAEDALDLLDHLGWGSDVHLVGVSLGGMIVQKMVSLQPDRFSTLVCTSTFHASFDLIPTPAEVKFFLTSFHKPWDEQIDPLLKLCFPKQWLNADVEKGVDVTNYQFMQMAMEELSKLSPPQTKEASLSQMHSTWVHYTTPKECKTIRRSKVRTIVIHGSKDKVIRHQCGKVLSKALKCPLITFERCGHMVMVEQPVRYNQVLRAHFEGRLIEENAQVIPLDTHFEISPLPAHLSRPLRTESDPTQQESHQDLFDRDVAPRSLSESPIQELPQHSNTYLTPPSSSVYSSSHQSGGESSSDHKRSGSRQLTKKPSWLNLKFPNPIKFSFTKEQGRPEYAAT
ncbi:alpha/beta-hydrolase [Basidiobolus meristosporus CBS 931.73]|uniref:Alpha/beta-hydrolase n=1 Tax=Basidiobolus meristosporus CBS 931.73 TaxID=1314790 RepID=A0A1Y1X052_9FUNG|nr:alpha/beta-hydrolase [Basidiobolus meristosporus CBS 931.73]|eukprot:ORX79113.1 alpha/beta-hydrolase [Basidiobolus meristosporus CBS 931.73]